MNGEVLLQNLFNIFIIAIIFEASIMAIFSMAVFKNLSYNAPVEMIKDVLILILSLVLCYKVSSFRLFNGTGIKLPYYLNTIISALVLMRLTKFVGDFLSRIKMSD